MSERERVESNRLSVEFEAATLSPAAESPMSRPYKIGWFIKSVDVNTASIRYRCFHFTRVMGAKFESLYLTSPGQVREAIHDLDALIVVKRVDRTVSELVALARHHNVPVFLDLCDDLISAGHSKNDQGLNLQHFLGMAPFLAGVTVPSAEMAERIEGYSTGHGVEGPPVRVIPDIAETWDVYRATFEAVTGTELPEVLEVPKEKGPLDPKQVVWFGNYGAGHSNFGMFSLKPYLKALKAVHAEIPLELVIVSNSRTVYRALVHNCGFPSRYVPWTPSAAYSALSSADVALVTTGDDEFCAIKSSNRVLQALAAGVPVITMKGPSIAEFEEAIFSGKVVDCLRGAIGPSHLRNVPRRLESARRILPRYTPERLGGIWAQLLTNTIEQEHVARAEGRPDKVLFLIESGDSLASAKELLAALKVTEGLDYDLMISTEFLREQPTFDAVLRKVKKIPRFFSEPVKGGLNLIIGYSAIVVDRPSAPLANRLSVYAAQRGTQTFTINEFIDGCDRRIAAANEQPVPVGSSISAGPYEEWVNADGTVEWSFIVNEKARGWILDAICREIGSRQLSSWQVSYHPAPSPKARNYFFSHYLLFEYYFADRRSEEMKDANIFIWYTHPREENPVTVAKLLLTFEKVTKVIFACESNRQIWLNRGLPADKTALVLGAADPELFRFHERGNGQIGLSSSFYERKNPDLLLEVMKLLPHRDFLLLGRNWNRYALFEEMKALPNFTYRSAPYRDYPDIHSNFDVFLSMSSLEGGPIPLVEAMMSNAVPVASRTGFAPDLIRHGENGFIFDLDASAEQIAELIEAAFDLPGNIRETAEQYSWENFSAEIVGLAN